MKCKKCKHEESKCSCIQQNECKPIDASCVIYNKDVDVSDISCIGEIPAGTSVKVILELIDRVFCEINYMPLIPCIRETLGFPVTMESTSQAVLLQAMQNYICNIQDTKVKASQSDTSTSYLIDKIDTGDCLDKSIVKDEMGNQKVKISINWGCLTTKIPLCFEVKSSECFVVDPGAGDCVPQPLTPTISKNNLTLTGINCNGNLQWYNNQNQLVGSGSTITAQANQSYYARCTTTCGESGVSNIITIGDVTTYIKVRSAVFTRNNCGVNECNIPCVGSSFTFSKTYTSTISQEHANSLAENDLAFALEGQDLINLQGTCVCSDCNCTFPIYNPNIVINNATCQNQVINANGQILIGGITNADKVGYSVGAGDYSGASYSGAFSLNNFSQGNIQTTPTSVRLSALSVETRVVFRLFNQSNTCYQDVVVNLTPPDCTKESVVINDVTVSCEIAPSTCINYRITAGATVASAWIENCTTGVYEFVEVPANQNITRCARSAPQVTGGVVTNLGNC